METLGLAGWSEPHRGALAPKLRPTSPQQSCCALLRTIRVNELPPWCPDQSDEEQREPQRRPQWFGGGGGDLFLLADLAVGRREKETTVRQSQKTGG